MSDRTDDTFSGETPQSLDELHPLGSAFGTGPEVYEETAETAAETFFRKDYRNALRLYSRLLLLDGARTEGWVGYVLCLLFQGEVDQAVIWARNAERSLPENPTVRAMQVVTQLIRRLEPVSPERLQAVQSGESEDPLFWVMMGWLTLEQKKSEKPEIFHRAEEMAGPDNWQVPMLAGSILEQYGKGGAASVFYKRAKAAFQNKFGEKVGVPEVTEPAADVEGANPVSGEKGLGGLVQRWLRRRKS